MANILGVGIATLDIINRVASYPVEDAEVRTLSQRVTRGGNVTNTLTVLSRLGHACHWGGVWVDEANGRRIRAELAADGIGIEHCRQLRQGCMPVSYICHSTATGSRTIVHHRDLPEFSCADFQAIATESFEWMHFEGRNVEETRQMLASLTDYSGTVSLEIEKPRPGIEALWPYPDVLLFGKHFVTSQGMHAEAFLPDIHRRWPEKKIFCAWGDAGAYTMVSGKFVHQPAFIPEQIVDTLGAGDTFNAGVIHALTQGATIENSLAFGVHLAGLKCGREGLLRREDNLPMGIGKSFLDAHLG